MEESIQGPIINKTQNQDTSLKILLIVSLIIIILVEGSILLIVFLGDDDLEKSGTNNNTNGSYWDNFTDSDDEVEKLKGRTIQFQQPEENSPEKHILVHIPEKEIFISTLHPEAVLYEDVTNDVEVKKCFEELKTTLNKKNIELITFGKALKLNKTALKSLASQALTYEINESNSFNKSSQQFQGFLNYTTEEYLNNV